jgi:hypothetical protein
MAGLVHGTVELVKRHCDVETVYFENCHGEFAGLIWSQNDADPSELKNGLAVKVLLDFKLSLKNLDTVHLLTPSLKSIMMRMSIVSNRCRSAGSMYFQPRAAPLISPLRGPEPGLRRRISA